MCVCVFMSPRSTCLSPNYKLLLQNNIIYLSPEVA